MPNLYIFDLDGVLFDNSHRQHLLPTGDGQTAEQWDAFNLACENDEPIHHMWQMLNEMLRASDGSQVLFLTGRSEVCRMQTAKSIAKVMKWKDDSFLVKPFARTIHMRPADEHRRAAEFKYDAIVQIKGETGGEYRIVLVDDDPSIIEACGPLVDRTILVKPFSGCSALVKTSVKTDIENWDTAPITAATHYHSASGSLMWLDDGFTSARIWVGKSWRKTYRPEPDQLEPITMELLLRKLNTNN